MSETSLRVVLDTNMVLRGLLAAGSAAGKVLDAAESRRFVPLISKATFDEYRAVLTDPELVEQFPGLAPRRVDLTLRRLRFVGDLVRHSRVHFDYPRDPKDACFIELAIAGHATHIISFDNDLLSLPSSRSDAGRRFRQRLPGIVVIDAPEFLRRHEHELG